MHFWMHFRASVTSKQARAAGYIDDFLLCLIISYYFLSSNIITAFGRLSGVTFLIYKVWSLKDWICLVWYVWPGGGWPAERLACPQKVLLPKMQSRPIRPVFHLTFTFITNLGMPGPAPVRVPASRLRPPLGSHAGRARASEASLWELLLPQIMSCYLTCFS